MRSSHTYYEILNVAPGAGADDVKAAYRRLLRTCHPDVGGSPALFDLVTEAYSVLVDPAHRDAAATGHRSAAAPAPQAVGQARTTAPRTTAPRPTAPRPSAAHAAAPRPAAHDDRYATLRRTRSSIWQPQPGTAYAPAPAPRPALVTLYL